MMSGRGPAFADQAKTAPDTKSGSATCQMRSPLASEWRPGDDHADRGDEIGNGGEKADGEIVETEGLEHLRHPEADAVKPDHQAEIDQAELDHAWIGRAPRQFHYSHGCGSLPPQRQGADRVHHAPQV